MAFLTNVGNEFQSFAAKNENDLWRHSRLKLGNVKGPQSTSRLFSIIYVLRSTVCSLQSAVYSLQAAVCSLQSANVRHRVNRLEFSFGRKLYHWHSTLPCFLCFGYKYIWKSGKSPDSLEICAALNAFPSWILFVRPILPHVRELVPGFTIW